MSDSNLRELVERAHQVGAALAEPKVVYQEPGGTGTAYAIVPDGYTLEQLNDLIDERQPTPRRKTGYIRLNVAASFAEYVGRHAEAGATVYIDPDQAAFTAVLNDHAANEPGWGDHVAWFALKATRAWKAWGSLSAQMVGQEEFADFLEDRIGEIAEPDGDQLFNLITDLHVKTNVNFRSAIERGSGRVKLTFEEEGDQGGGATADIKVPEKITVQVVPYEGTDPVVVTGRFRFRAAAGKASFGYDLDEEIARVREESVATTAEALAGALGDKALFVYGAKS